MYKMHGILIGLLCECVDVLVIEEKACVFLHQEPGGLYVA